MSVAVIAIEPLDVNIQLLQRSLQINGLEDLVSIYRAGIIATRGVASQSHIFSSIPGNYAASAVNSVKMTQLGTFEIETGDTTSSSVDLTTLAEIVGTKKVELLSLNCQGCEYDALLSLGRRLSDVRGVLLYVYFKSMFRCTKRHAESAMAVRLLHNAGFCFFDLLDPDSALTYRAPQPIVDVEAWQDDVVWGRTQHNPNFFIFASRECKSPHVSQFQHDSQQNFSFQSTPCSQVHKTEECTNVHGDNHPLASIVLFEEHALVSSVVDQRRMLLRFGVVGIVPGLEYILSVREFTFDQETVVQTMMQRFSVDVNDHYDHYSASVEMDVLDVASADNKHWLLISIYSLGSAAVEVSILEENSLEDMLVARRESRLAISSSSLDT